MLDRLRFMDISFMNAGPIALWLWWPMDKLIMTFQFLLMMIFNISLKYDDILSPPPNTQRSAQLLFSTCWDLCWPLTDRVGLLSSSLIPVSTVSYRFRDIKSVFSGRDLSEARYHFTVKRKEIAFQDGT